VFRRTSFRLALLALTGSVLLAPTANAQFARSGASTSNTCSSGVAVCDVNWSVTWFNLSTLATGTVSRAAIIPAIGGTWAPNIAGVQQWIGAARDGNIGFASRYYFQSTFTQNTSGTVNFGLGWDNRLVGAYVGGAIDPLTGLFTGGTSLLPGTSPTTPFSNGQAGFCRSDGVFPSSQYPNCVLNIAIGVNASQSNVLTFVVEGDGTTDGLLVGAAQGANVPPVVQIPPSTTVPEPGTIGLTLMGIVAIGAVRRRSARVAS